MTKFALLFSAEAQQDLERLFDFALQRELDSDTGDFDITAKALTVIQQSIALLEHAPFSCRMASNHPFVRELMIPLGHTGYVALFEIVNQATVIIGAVRHQREDDYH